MFRDCGECTACCIWPFADSFGWNFGAGKSCKFLECNGCGVYKVRPEPCRHYQCAWTQHLLPEEMRPDKCNFLVSIERNTDGVNYIKVLIINDKEITKSEEEWFHLLGEKLNIPVAIGKNKVSISKNYVS